MDRWVELDRIAWPLEHIIQTYRVLIILFFLWTDVAVQLADSYGESQLWSLGVIDLRNLGKL